MQTPIFLSSRQAAELLGFPLKTTLALLISRGVLAVDLGPGRKKGLRWPLAAVRGLADTLQAEAQTQTPPAKKRREKPHSVQGKSVSELFSELAQ